jgi:hypothetical protein
VRVVCIGRGGSNPRFWVYVHDKDTGVRKLFAEQGYMVELLDRNHALRAAFKRIFDKNNAVVPREKEHRRFVLQNIDDRLRRHVLW